MNSPLRSMVVLSLFALGGCAGGQVGEESSVVCAPVVRDRLAVGDGSPLGFAAADVLGSVEGTFSGTLRYADGAETEARLSLRYPGGQVEFQDREWSDDSAMVSALSLGDCNDVLAIPLRLSFETDDGTLVEAWDVVLLAETPDTANTSVAPITYAGSIDVARFALMPGELSTFVSIEIGPAEVRVEITGTSARVEDDVASAAFFDIATWVAARN